MSNTGRSNNPVALKKIKMHVNQPHQHVNEILNKDDVKVILNISDRTLRNYINKGYLQPSLVGNKLFFLYSNLLELMERSKVKVKKKDGKKG